MIVATDFGTDGSKRFWDRATLGGADECWNWKNKLAGGGYGRFCFNHRIYKAHRVAYALANGPVPDELAVCHRCDNRKCVNPKHLFLGTLADNNADMRAKGRGCNPPAMRNRGTFTSERTKGTNHPQAKLTKERLSELLVLASQGATTKFLANQFGLSIRHVNKLRERYGTRKT